MSGGVGTGSRAFEFSDRERGISRVRSGGSVDVEDRRTRIPRVCNVALSGAGHAQAPAWYGCEELGLPSGLGPFRSL